MLRLKVLPAFLVLVLLLGSFWIIKSNDKVVEDSKHENNVVNIPDETARKRYEVSVNRGLDYLDRTSDNVSGLSWLMLDYLQRKFDLDSKFSTKKHIIKTPTEEQDALEFQIHRRIAYPSELVDKLPLDGASQMRQMMMIATHCDHIPLPPDFERLVKQNIESGEYDLTHVAYSLERMKENGCSFPKDKDQQLRQQAAYGMKKLAANSDTRSDLRYEAIAFLLHMGRRDLIQKSWLDTLLSEQQADGGWKLSSSENKSHDHATVLAIWGLLEYSRPDVPAEPVLRRPNR